MIAFRTFLIAYFLCLLLYTGIVILNHGMNLLPIFFGDMLALTWPGQFNFDFMGFLALSALWTAWRHQFSRGGLALALVAFFGGMAFLAPYLLVVSQQAKGNIKEILMGPGRLSV
ncbi:MAG: hypothetical protein ACFHX7_19155 [Pseudomonadota bacterium]